MALLGPRFSESRKGTETVIRYELTNFEESPFLKRYNQAVYFGVYRFQGVKLIGFEFGFAYP